MRIERLQRDIRVHGVTAGEHVRKRCDVGIVLRDPAEELVACGRDCGWERDARACLCVDGRGRGDAGGHGEGDRVAERIDVAVDEGIPADGAGMRRVALRGGGGRGHDVVIGAVLSDLVAAVRARLAVRAVVVRRPCAVRVRMRRDGIGVVVGDALDFFLPELRLVGRVAGVDDEVAVGALHHIGVTGACGIADLHADVVEIILHAPVAVIGFIRRTAVKIAVVAAHISAGRSVPDGIGGADGSDPEYIRIVCVPDHLAVQRHTRIGEGGGAARA